MAACAAALALVSWLIWLGLEGFATRLGSELLVVGFMLVGGGAAYLGAARVLRLEELVLLRTLLRRGRGVAPQALEVPRADETQAVEGPE